MKKHGWVLVIFAIVAMIMADALADSAYIRYISSGKGVAGHATHTTNKKVHVSQSSNVNTETGVTGPKIHYGARKTNTSLGSSICNAMSVEGYSGYTSASYKSGQKPSNGSTVYLVVQPAAAATTGQWEIAGNWAP